MRSNVGKPFGANKVIVQNFIAFWLLLSVHEAQTLHNNNGERLLCLIF